MISVKLVLVRKKHNLDDVYVMSTPPTDIDLVDQTYVANPLDVIAANGIPLTKRKQLVPPESELGTWQQ